MTTIFIEDSPRNSLAKWAEDAQSRGPHGVVVSPFTTPTVGNGYKPSAADCLARLRSANVPQLWVDPATHALQMPTVGDFRYYDQWELWGGSRGDLTTVADVRDHVQRVFAMQSALQVPFLAPTVLLHNPTSQASENSLTIARAALDLASGAPVHVTVAGSGTFWGSGPSLDAHVGALAQLDAAGWFVVQARPNNTLPVQTTPEEVHGLCRTVRSLSEIGPVHVSHGDLAALPAVAAGATSVGTGWDTRQRVVAYTSYAQRSTGDGGGWFKRPTLQGLCAFLRRQDAELLVRHDAALAVRVVPNALPPNAPLEAFLHHTACLQRLLATIQVGSYRDRYENLHRIYSAALADWRQVSNVIRTSSDERAWITPVNAGLTLYGTTEGWAP